MPYKIMVYINHQWQDYRDVMPPRIQCGLDVYTSRYAAVDFAERVIDTVWVVVDAVSGHPMAYGDCRGKQSETVPAFQHSWEREFVKADEEIQDIRRHGVAVAQGECGITYYHYPANDCVYCILSATQVHWCGKAQQWAAEIRRRCQYGSGVMPQILEHFAWCPCDECQAKREQFATIKPEFGEQAGQVRPEDRPVLTSAARDTPRHSGDPPDAPQAPADLIIAALTRVAEVIEATYDHDEQGHRTNEAGRLSGADVIEALCFHEELVFQALEAAKGMPRLLAPDE